MSTESAGASPGSAKVRASDAEREEYARIVRDAAGDGRLGLDEADERLATIYAARFRDELRPLVTDLPREDHEYEQGGARPPRGPRPGDSGRGPEWRGSDRRDREWRGAGRRGVGRRGFARHAGFVAIVAGVLIAIWAITGSHFFWPAIPLALLAFGLLRRGCWLGWRPAGRR